MNREGECRFQFRTEKTSELVKCLAELGLSVSEEQLTQADKHKDAIAMLFGRLAELCTGEEGTVQPVLSGVNYPELHEESAANLRTFRSIQKMMETCGINSFALKDLMSPEAKRVRRFLSGIINFLKFREEKLGLLSELNASRDVLLERLATHKAKGETVGNRLNRLKEQTSEDSKLIIRIEDEIKDIESRIASLNQQQSDVREESAQLKVRGTHLKEEIVKKTAVFEDLQSTKKTLSSQVVSSPDKFRKRILDTGVALQGEQREAKAAERRIRELSSWVANVEDSQVEVNAALDAMNDFRAEVERQKLVVADVDTVRQQVEARAEMAEDAEQGIHQATRTATRLDEKISHLRRQAQSRTVEGQTALGEMQAQAAQAEANRAKSRAKAERYEADCDRLERELEEEVHAMDQDVGDMAAAYKRLERLVSEHLRGLTQSLNMDMLPVHAV